MSTEENKALIRRFIEGGNRGNVTEMPHLAVRRYKFKSGSLDEILRFVNEGYLPLITQSPGFLTQYYVDEGNGDLFTVSLFQDQATTVVARSIEPYRCAPSVLHPRSRWLNLSGHRCGKEATHKRMDLGVPVAVGQ